MVAVLGLLEQLWRLTWQWSGPSWPGWLQGSTSESPGGRVGPTRTYKRPQATFSLKFNLSTVFR